MKAEIEITRNKTHVGRIIFANRLEKIFHCLNLITAAYGLRYFGCWPTYAAKMIKERKKAVYSE